MQQKLSLYVFEYTLDKTFKGPMIIDISIPRCMEQDIRIPLEKYGVDFSVFTQLVDVSEG